MLHQKTIKKGVLFLSLLMHSFVFGQGSGALIGGYTIRNYTAKSYRMHPRNCYITQDQRGIVYFGNIYGIMNFDGNYWQATHLPNGTSGFSLGLGHDKKMYVGSHHELGFISYDSIGENKYQSLLEAIPKQAKNMGAVWQVLSTKNATLFFSSSQLLSYSNNSFHSIKGLGQEDQFQFADKIDEVVYVHTLNKGLHTFENNTLSTLPGGDFFKQHTIKALVKINANQLMVFEEHQIYVWNNGIASPVGGELATTLKKNTCTHAIKLKDENILVTTLENGFYIINQQGLILKHVTIDHGLQSNFIHYAYQDDRNNVWLALDNGVAYVEINSPFSFIGHSNGVPGMGFSAALYKNNLYLATSQGLFYTPWAEGRSSKEFKPVMGIEGQVWSLSVIDHTLLCCQGEKSFQIENNQAIPLQGGSKNGDNWTFIPLKKHPGFALKGTYKGFELYQLKNNRWTFIRKINGFDESSRIVVEDRQHTLWVCHGNKGLYRLLLNETLDAFIQVENISIAQHFAPDFFIDVSMINGRIVLSSQQGIYTVEEQSNKLVKDVALEKICGANLYVNKIIQSEDENIWLFLEDDILLYKKTKQGAYNAVNDLLHKLTGSLVGCYEFVIPLNHESAIIGSQDGFVLFSMNNKSSKNKPYHVLIRKVEANFKNDSLLFGGNFSNENQVALLKQEHSNTWSYGFNSLRISFSALFFESNDKTVYQYALAHPSDTQVEWSGWTSNTQIVFSNLSEGDYTFHVRAKNIYGQLSEEGLYSFRISPPWYRSAYAYLAYFAMLSALIYVGSKFIRKRFKAQREKLEEQKEKELKLAEQEFLNEIIRKEKEIIAIKNEQLEEKVARKQSELASLATNLNQKTELLMYLKDKFKHIDKEPDQPNDKLFKEVMKSIDQQFDVEDNWTKFQAHFDEIHHNFLHRLQEKYPKLDQSWLLLCAYIRMNKSNKEMAAQMNISVAAVEKRRYRLKEKLELDNDSKLVDFILNF
jgi:ligand-binding sensor domain-containing protein